MRISAAGPLHTLGISTEAPFNFMTRPFLELDAHLLQRLTACDIVCDESL